MPLNINLPITTDPTKPIYSRDRLMYEPLIPRGNVYRSPIDISDYSRYVKNPIITGNLEADLDSLTETRASNQPYSHRLGNSLVKLGGKSLIHTAGGLASIPAIISSLAKGEGLQGYVDNELFKGIDDAEEWLNKAFPHYLTKAQQNYTLAQKLNPFGKAFYNSGFWGDTFLGGAAFLIGAVGSDLILTRGAGLISRLAKSTAGLNKVVSKAATSATKSGLDLTAKAIGINDELAKKGFLNTLGSVGRLGISTLTSTGYESALEARHYKEHALQGLKEQFRQQNFRDPNEQELALLEQTANNASNAVFALNAVTVGINNALLLGKVLNTPFSKFLDDIELSKARRRIDIDNVTGVANVKPRTKFQKILDGIAVGSTAFREGLEEGLQAAYSEGLFEHALSKHDLNALDEIGVLSGIFNEGFAKAFGTQEGLEEVLVGLLLGLTGVPGLGVKGSIAQGIERYRGKDAYSQFLNQLAEDYTKNPDTNLHKVGNATLQMYQINKARGLAIDGQDLFDIKNEEGRLLWTWLNSRNSLGTLDESIEQMTATIEEMSDTEFKEKYDKATDIEVAEAKKQVITSLKDAGNRYKKAYDLANRYTQGDVMSPQDRMQTEAIALLAYQVYDLDGRESAIAKNLQSMYSGFNIDIDKALNKLGKAKSAIKGRITRALNTEKRLNEQIEALQNDLDVATKEYQIEKKSVENPSTAKMDSITKQLAKLNEQKLKVNQDKRDALREDLIENEALANELSNNNTVSIEEYQNNIDSYIQQLEQAVTQQDRLEKAIKTLDRFNYDKLMTELSDLGRIAKKRESLLIAWDYIKSDRGKEKYSNAINEFRAALVQKHKFDLMYLASIEDMIKENNLDKKPSLNDALDLGKAILDAKFVEELADKYIIEEFNVYEAKHNTDPSKNIKVAVTKHKDGNIRIYKIDDNYNRVDSELDVEDFTTEYAKLNDTIIDHNSIIESYKTDIKALEVGSDAYNKAVRQLANYVGNKDIKIDGNEISYTTDAGISQILATPEDIFNVLSDSINNKIKQTYNYNKFIKQLVGNEYSSVNLVETYTKDKDTIVSKYEDSLIKKYNKDFNTMKSLLFKQYSSESLQQVFSRLASNDTRLLASDELDVESAVAQEALNNDADFATYQSQYFYNIGRYIKSNEPKPSSTPEALEKKEKEASNKPPTIFSEPEDVKDKGGEKKKDASKDVSTVKPKNKKQPDKKQPDEEIKPEKQDDKSEVIVTGKLNNFLEISVLKSSGYTKEVIDEVVEEIKKVKSNPSHPFELRFEIEAQGDYNPKSPNSFTEHTNYAITKGNVIKGKRYFIHITLNGKRIGRLLSGNRFINLESNEPLDFSNLEDLKLYNDTLTIESVELFKQGQVALNKLNELIVANPSADLQTLLEQSGFEPITREALNTYVPIEDSKLNELINLPTVESLLNVDNSYPISQYGIKLKDGNVIQPVFNKGKLVTIRQIDESGKVVNISSTGVLNNYVEELATIFDDRMSRDNETTKVILVQDPDGKVRSIDVFNSGVTNEEKESYAESLFNKFKTNKNGSNFLDKRNNTLADNLLKIFVQKPETSEIKIGDTIYNVGDNIVRISTIFKDGVLYFNIVRELSLDSNLSVRNKYGSLSYQIRLSKDDTKYSIVLPDGTIQEVSNSNNTIDDILTTIIQDLINNQEDRLNRINDLRLYEKTKEKETVSSEGIGVTTLGNISIASTESYAFYPLMIPLDVASSINVNSSVISKLIPNDTFVDLRLAEEEVVVPTKLNIFESTETFTSEEVEVKPPVKPGKKVEPKTKTESSSTIVDADDKPFNIVSVDNTIFKELGIDIETLKRNGDVYYTDENGNLCASKGLSVNKFTAGSKWSVVKDLKNMPTHSQGGVDLVFDNGSVRFRGDNGNEIMANDGLIIKSYEEAND